MMGKGMRVGTEGKRRRCVSGLEYKYVLKRAVAVVWEKTATKKKKGEKEECVKEEKEEKEGVWWQFLGSKN